jgi:hypothetical protein
LYHSNNTAPLVRVELSKLRPTQLSVGYAEVQIKARQWARLRKKRRKSELQEHVFPAVLGLNKEYFIVDHHHLGIALMEAGIDAVYVAVLDDLSWLERTVFWRTMEFRAWSHPYDHRGRRRDYRDMPQSLKKLENDPYRSLAGMVRDAGGFAKDQAPFVEFLWADYFRPLVPARLIDEKPARATRDGVRLAQSHIARYLPGWSGKTPA